MIFFFLICFLVQRGQLRRFLCVSATLLSEQFTTTLNPFSITAFCYGWAWNAFLPSPFYIFSHFAFLLKLQGVGWLETDGGFSGPDFLWVLSLWQNDILK